MEFAMEYKPANKNLSAKRLDFFKANAEDPRNAVAGGVFQWVAVRGLIVAGVLGCCVLLLRLIDSRKQST
jgi:hypothetical protein